MPEQRLIDANAMWMDFNTNDIYRGNIDGLAKCINAQPTINAVEVVRCKYCDKQQGCKNAQYLGLDGFCSYGERKVRDEV